jgi:apolipoprotein N-acyltransferase
MRAPQVKVATENINDGADSRTVMRAVVYTPTWRVVAGLLSLLSGASLLIILGLLFFSDTPPSNPLRLIRLASGLCLLPALSLALLRLASAAMVRVDAGKLHVEQRQRRIVVPLDSIAGLEPWILPLPGSGVWVRLRSGARLREGLQLADPASLVEALVAAGLSPELAQVRSHPAVVHARSKQAAPSGFASRLLFKFPVFALVPTLPVFRVHQLIAYGGAFGEYYQYGLSAYLLGFAIYWASFTVHLLLYAAALRVPVELLCLAAVMLTPDRASAVRRVTEKCAMLLFYVGVPVVLILRFIPW